MSHSHDHASSGHGHACEGHSHEHGYNLVFPLRADPRACSREVSLPAASSAKAFFGSRRQAGAAGS